MLEIKNLIVSGNNNIPILDDINLIVKKGECIGLTGASGSGKTSLIKSILGMDTSSYKIKQGGILLEKVNILSFKSKKRRELCGKTFGFVPQNPMTSFFPNKKIGKQMIETFRLHNKNLNKFSANLLSKKTLNKVNMNDLERIMNSYPSQLSGGMLQRVTMAILLGLHPTYIFADEPTSALDEINRNLLIKLLKKINNDTGIIFISHDIVALKELCSQINVMQNGKIVETQTVEKLFSSPQQIWTKTFVKTTQQNMEDNEWIQLI